MRLEPIITRLGSLGLATLGSVLDHAVLTGAPGAMPAAYVIPEAKTGSGSALAGAIDQKVDAEFTVLLMLNPAAGVVDQLATQSAAVVDRLLGWTHPDAEGATLYRSEKLVSASPALLVWAVRFAVPFRLRKAA